MVGREFAASQEVIPIVAMAYVVWGLGYHSQLGMVLTNKTKTIGLISIGTVVLNLCLNYFLIGAYGMFGAAWATLLSFLAIAAASFWFSQRVLPLPLNAGRVICGVAIAVGLYALSYYWRPRPIAAVLLFKACLLAAYPVFLWKGRVLSGDERSTLREAVLAPLHRRARGGTLA
jgi:O-antigen/teichoic acid export membrane protein